jgi:hypothetical protein
LTGAVIRLKPVPPVCTSLVGRYAWRGELPRDGVERAVLVVPAGYTGLQLVCLRWGTWGRDGRMTVRGLVQLGRGRALTPVWIGADVAWAEVVYEIDPRLVPRLPEPHLVVEQCRAARSAA